MPDGAVVGSQAKRQCKPSVDGSVKHGHGTWATRGVVGTVRVASVGGGSRWETTLWHPVGGESTQPLNTTGQGTSDDP